MSKVAPATKRGFARLENRRFARPVPILQQMRGQVRPIWGQSPQVGLFLRLPVLGQQRVQISHGQGHGIALHRRCGQSRLGDLGVHRGVKPKRL